MPESEANLLHYFQRKDPDAFRKLYERYAGKMMAVCIRYMGNREEAQDVMQDGFMKVLKHIHEFRAEGSLEGWIRRIMVNTALHTIKKDKLRFANDVNEQEFEIHSSFDEALDNLSVKELLDMISALPNGYRTVFNLFVMEGYSHKEIANELGITDSTSRSQLTKARSLLQEQIVKQRNQVKKSLPSF